MEQWPSEHILPLQPPAAAAEPMQVNASSDMLACAGLPSPASFGAAGPKRFHVCRCLLAACGRGSCAAGRSCRPSCTVRRACRCGRSQRSASLLRCTPAGAGMRHGMAADGRPAHTLPRRGAPIGRAALRRRIPGSAAGSRGSQMLPGSACAGRGRAAATMSAALLAGA